MKFWWIVDPARLRDERAGVEALVEEGWWRPTRWRIHDGRLTAEGEIEAHGVWYAVRLFFPDLYPLVPAWVQPIEEVQWSHHQYGKGGALCLELRPDNWVPTATGAHVLRSAHHLLMKENPLGEGNKERVESAHFVGEVQRFDWGENPVLLETTCFDRILQGVARDVQAISWLTDGEVHPLLVTDDVARTNGGREPPRPGMEAWRFKVSVLITNCERQPEALSDRKALAEALGIESSLAGVTGSVLVIARSKEDTVAYHSPSDERVVRRPWQRFRDQPGARSGRDSVTAGKTVAVVGLGSVGGKVAEMLARSGVKRLVLVDGDVMLPGNLERHVLDWRDVGLRKVKRMKQRLENITPDIQVHLFANNLNWQRSAKTHATQVDAIAACDLVVDATGDVATGLFLGAVAADAQRAFLSVQVFEGGLGAIVARSLPGRDPPYGFVRQGYYDYCNERDVEPPPSGHGTYDALDDAGEPIVADDASATMAAAHAARVALDILDDRVGADDAACLLFGFRKGWLFERHGHTVSLDMGVALPKPEAEAEFTTKEFVLELLRELENASANPE